MPRRNCTGDQVNRYGNRMADPWNFAGPVARLDSTANVVTLVDESTFAISGSSGDMAAGAAQGLFFRDTRILSRLELLVNGARTEPLAAITDDPVLGHLRVPVPARPGPGRLHPHGVPLPLRRPGHA